MKFKLMIRFIIVVLVATLAGVALSNLIKGWGISEELGNNYIFTSDNGILYQLDNREYFVIPYGITSINYNDKWIIAKTIGLNASYRNCRKQCNDGSQYWIINKDVSIIKIDSINSSNIMLIKDYEYPILSNSLIGPLDSISFCNKLNELRIKLVFRK